MEGREEDRNSEGQGATGSGLTLFPFVQVTPRYILWFTVVMIVLSIAVLTNSAVHYFRAGWTLYQAVFNTFRDISTSIPVVAGGVALALNSRRIWMSIATYFEQKTEELKKKQRAEVHAEWRAWNERRLQAEARGEPFDEPVPGDKE